MSVLEQDAEIAEIEDTSFEVRWQDGKTFGIVVAIGEIDLSAVSAFKSALIEAADAEDALIIDLTAVVYMDSSGFSILLDVNRILKPLGLPILLAGANPNIQRMLTITRLDSIFRMFSTVDEAIASMRAVPV